MKRKILIAFFITLIIIFLIQIDTESLLLSITQISFFSLFLLLFLQIITQLLVNLQWFKIANFASKAPIKFWTMFYINCQGALVDFITPGVKFGGEATRIVQLKRLTPLDGQEAATTMLLQKSFSLTALFSVQTLSLSLLMGALSLPTHWQILIYVFLFIFLVIFLSILLIPKKLQKLKFSRFNFVALFLKTSITVPIKTKINLFLLSFLIWFLYPVKIYILAVQIFYGTNLPPAALISAVAFVAYMVAMLPIFPGGLGGFEASSIALLYAIGFTISAATATTLTFRFVTFWFVVLFSFVFISIYKIIHFRGKKL